MTRSIRLGWLGACLAAAATLEAPPSKATPPSLPPLAWPPGGLPIVRQQGDQAVGDVVGDARGGIFVAWADASAGEGELDIRLQRVDGYGRVAWRTHLASGLPVSTAPKRQSQIRLAPDGVDGVIATWHDERGISPDIYALRVTGDGAIAPGWPVDGAAISLAAGTQTNPVVAPDGAGGAYVAWEDFRNGFANGRIFARRITGSGEAAAGWPVDGIQIASGTGIEFQPAILSDSEGGAFVVWDRYWPATSNSDLFAIRLTPAGAIAPGWPDSGLAICAAPGRQDSPSIVPDGEGGFFALWRDYRDDPDLTDGAESDIYGQRVTALGAFPPGWGGDGIPLRAAPGDEGIPKAAPDRAGGVLIAWANPASGLPNVFVQRITAEGTVAPGWSPAGVATGTTTATGQAPELVGDGSGGAIVAWTDHDPSTLDDVHVQRITAAGVRADGWAAAGVPVAAGAGDQRVGAASSRLASTVVGDGSGGALLAWTDWGATEGADILVQRITAAGVVGPWSCSGCDGILGVAPNPGTGRFRLELKNPESGSSAAVRIYDVAGRLLRASRITGLAPLGTTLLDLDLTDLPSGVYFIGYSFDGPSPLLGRRQVTIVR